MKNNKRNIYARSYYKKNKEKLREYFRKWQKLYRNTEKYRLYMNKYMKSWRPKRRKELRERNRLWRNKNKTWVKNYNSTYNIARRDIVLKHYGNKCNCCGENKKEFLAIDHINNDGYLQRKKFKFNNRYNWIIKNKFPKDLQILCHNCNLAKAFYGKCPHKKETK